MSEHLDGSVEVDLGGKPRRIVYTFGALEKFEKATGHNAMQPGVFKGLTAAEWLTFVWCGLVTHEPNLKRDDVGKWLTLPKLRELQEQILAAYAGAQPEPSEDDTPRPPVAAEH